MLLIDRIDKSSEGFFLNALELRESSRDDKEEGNKLHHYYRHLGIFFVNTFIKCINENPTKENQIKRKQTESNSKIIYLPVKLLLKYSAKNYGKLFFLGYKDKTEKQ